MLKTCVSLFKKQILLYVALGFALQFSGAYGIHLFQQLLDSVPRASGLGELAAPLLLYGGTLAVFALLSYLSEYPETALPRGITEKLKVLALARVSKMDYAAYQNMGTGQLIQIVDNGAEAGAGIVHGFYLRILHELLPTLLFSLLFIGLYNPVIMLTIAAGYVFVFLLTRLLLKFLYSVKESLLASQESLSRYSVRGFMELAVFRLNRRYKRELRRMNDAADDVVRKNVRIRMVHESFFAMFELLVVGVKIAVLALGIREIIAGRSTIGVTLALLLLVDKVYSPIAIFNVVYVDYKLHRLAYQRFETFLNAPADRNLERGAEISELRGEIAFERVSFGYGKKQALLLRDVSFHLPAGSSTAIVGLSGSGKSTLVKLLLGLLKKSSGRILVDGKDIDELRLDSLYARLSYISQDAPVFDDTLRGNLVFDEPADDGELRRLLGDALLGEKMRALPDGLDTPVGERGMKLSGGEKQRLAFARVFAQDRELVILDEPVSALDNISERRLMKTALDRFRGRTLIVVAHRLHAIRSVDRILLMRSGQLVGEGSFDELLERSAYFRELWSKDGEN
ncbi:ABC transporter ATP-binding protein [Saccharibacillus sp. CPCC 101409]|uniref:ABC transporter ATP-binding protein n=1 Tax=Saccharibacillus sp. CPCC 101409 TaxID=3058041 RepID=UPI002672BDEC|nr:ABC transporter ATP-binding protein [Saccharibacillus sp. CPCC 101409]MDO3408175.1 ABC transporter ATP-binding protein [Saccharibacillus sp. CPCC 101409]